MVKLRTTLLQISKIPTTNIWRPLFFSLYQRLGYVDDLKNVRDAFRGPTYCLMDLGS